MTTPRKPKSSKSSNSFKKSKKRATTTKSTVAKELVDWEAVHKSRDKKHKSRDKAHSKRSATQLAADLKAAKAETLKLERELKSELKKQAHALKAIAKARKKEYDRRRYLSQVQEALAEGVTITEYRRRRTTSKKSKKPTTSKRTTKKSANSSKKFPTKKRTTSSKRTTSKKRTNPKLPHPQDTNLTPRQISYWSKRAISSKSATGRAWSLLAANFEIDYSNKDLAAQFARLYATEQRAKAKGQYLGSASNRKHSTAWADFAADLDLTYQDRNAFIHTMMMS